MDKTSWTYTLLEISLFAQDLDAYQSTYSFNHKPFSRAEQMAGPFWNR